MLDLFYTLVDTRIGWTLVGFITGCSFSALIAAWIVIDGIYKSEESDMDYRDDIGEYGPSIVHDYTKGQRVSS